MADEIEIILKRAARFDVNADLLRMLLGLPEDTVVLYVQMDNPGVLTVCVEQKDLPLIREDEELPVIVPLFGRTTQGHVRLVDWRAGKPLEDKGNDEAKGN